MAKAVIGGMPDGLVIGGKWTLRWQAEDPSTGATVAGVVVSNVNIDADDVSDLVGGGGTGGLEVGPFMLVPGPEA